MKPTTKNKEAVRIQSISYIGNPQTTKHKNNVRIYVQPYFDSSDILTVIDMKKKVKHSTVNVVDISCGKYTYQRITNSLFSKHTGQDCMLIPLDKAKPTTGKLNKYLLTSNTNKNKKSILMVILDKEFHTSMVNS